MTAYDEIRYPGLPYAQAHPQHLAAIARLFGVVPAPPERCRVLEVACGDGAHLIPIAWQTPGSRFVGFDLARAPIEAGQQFAARLGLANLSLAPLDLCDFPAESGEFDYIIAHGLYSWVPASVRDRLLGLVARHLAPQGIGYVSYNTYPGCYMRRMVWEMLRFHTDLLPDPQQRAREAHALLGLLAEAQSAPNDFGTLLRAQGKRILDRPAEYLLHDDLAETNEPVYFHEFLRHAEQHGLQYLGEAELGAMGTAGITAQVRAVLEQLDPVSREQYLDFVRGRQFRQTLLCRGEVTVDRTPGEERLDGLVFSVSRYAQVEGEGGADEQVLQAALDLLREREPRRLRVDEVQGALRTRVPALLAGRAPEYLSRLLLIAVRAGAIELHSQAPSIAVEPGERPQASAVARLQLAGGGPVTTLTHEAVAIDDEATRVLLGLLDGSRGRPQLTAELGDRLGGDAGGRAHALDARLRHLAKLALLVA
jgi:SAM-dependent methyltransferase